LRALVDTLDVDRVVVGLPLSLSGADSAQTAEARDFAERLRSELTVPVELYDERFTTQLAQRAGGAASEDSRSAAYLLESWLAAHGADTDDA
jgi:putative Holliday junction resolvase